MKTQWSENDVAFKSDNPGELLEIGLEYLNSPVPGLRNELERMIQRSKGNGPQPGKKSPFEALYDPLRKEYALVSRDRYDPQCLLAMLFELLTETEFKSTVEEEMQVRSDQIHAALTLIAKNEEIDLTEATAFLEEKEGEWLQMLHFYRDDDAMTEAQLERLSDKFDTLYLEPIHNAIQGIMNQLVSGNLTCRVETGQYPLPNSNEMA